MSIGTVNERPDLLNSRKEDCASKVSKVSQYGMDCFKKVRDYQELELTANPIRSIYEEEPIN